MPKKRSPKVDRRLLPGHILLVVRDHAARASIVENLRRPDLIGKRHRLLCVDTASAMREALVPPKLPPDSGKRRELPWKPLCGIVLAWDATALEALAILDDVSPRTRMLAFPAQPDPELVAAMMRECDERKIVWAREAPTPEQLRVVFDRLFLPFDARRLAFRTWVIARASSGRVQEHLLRVAEGAIFHEIPEGKRPDAHGVTRESVDQYVLQLEHLLGAPIDQLRSQYLAFLQGRGAPAVPLFECRFRKAPPNRDEPPPRTRGPSARRTR